MNIIKSGSKKEWLATGRRLDRELLQERKAS
jgi:hypothetical protein